MTVIETIKGLPNTCSNCGNDAGATWFAPNVDVALSGGGLCDSCANPPKEKPQPKTDDKPTPRGK
jgi:hypothetical protein